MKLRLIVVLVLTALAVSACVVEPGPGYYGGPAYYGGPVYYGGGCCYGGGGYGHGVWRGR
jgi:hypothetical protein